MKNKDPYHWTNIGGLNEKIFGERDLPKPSHRALDFPPKLGDKGKVFSPWRKIWIEVEVTKSPEEEDEFLYWHSYVPTSQEWMWSRIMPDDLWEPGLLVDSEDTNPFKCAKCERSFIPMDWASDICDNCLYGKIRCRDEPTKSCSIGS